jgi:tartrate dehydratase beta subunit/fumarate hydratase class I family protein
MEHADGGHAGETGRAGGGHGAIHVTVNDLEAAIPTMRAGARVYLSGDIYTARDAAHKEIFRLLEAGEPPPFELRGAVVYYVGPTPVGQAPGRPRAIG